MTTLERWLSGKRRIRPSTRTQYEEHVRLHIVPVLGGHRLVDLRRRHVEGLVDDRLRYVAPGTGRPLSPATVGKILWEKSAVITAEQASQYRRALADAIEASKERIA